MTRLTFVVLLATAHSISFSQSAYIANVPDIVQPPALPAWLNNPNNWCTPTASANIFAYWNANGWAGIAGGFANRNLAGELGWFMDTNDQVNGKGVAPDFHAGTYDQDPRGSGFDALNGLKNWCAFDVNTMTFGTANVPYPGPAPVNKIAYPWQVSEVIANGFQNAKTEIDSLRPLLACFRHWDIFNTGVVVGVGGVNMPLYDFNEPPHNIGGSTSEGSWEQDFGLGHCVTVVGYAQNVVYNGQNVNVLAVHDTIPAAGAGTTTPVDLAILFDGHWKYNFDVVPVPEPSILVAFGAAGLAFARRRRM